VTLIRIRGGREIVSVTDQDPDSTTRRNRTIWKALSMAFGASFLLAHGEGQHRIAVIRRQDMVRSRAKESSKRAERTS